MAGNKKKFNKPKSRRPTKPSLFVEGGLLSDWSPIITSPPSRGKSNNNNNSNNTTTGNKLNASNNKSALRFEIGGSSNGKSKASGSNSKIIGSQKPKKNAFAYQYPQAARPFVDESSDGSNKFDKSNPIVLLDSKDSKIIAYMDETAAPDSETVKYTYDYYGATFEVDDSYHRGLGFHDVAEEEESPSVVIEPSPVIEKKERSVLDSSSSQEMETDIMDDDDDASSSPVTNSGFLSIGGMKLYTHDISDEEEEEEEEEEDDDDEESLDSSESEESSDSSCDRDGAYNSDCDIDDEIAKDYFEGIGGSYKVANVDKLIGRVVDSSDDEEDDDTTTNGRFNEMLKGIGGIGLQDASREYGMRKPSSRKKSRPKPSSKFVAATDDWSDLDDLMLEKNPRRLHGKKKHAAKVPQSWPSKAEKSKNFQRFSGEKKKLRQDRIASKRRDRMIRRGVDLEQINFKLEQMVQKKGDIMSFQLMHSRDCSQVQKLSTIYRLRSVTQGSGQKRFVTVTRTQHTGMPSSNDRLRLEKLLGIDDDEANDMMTPNKIVSKRTKKGSNGAPGFTSPADPKSAKTKTPGESSKKKRRDRDKIGTYATQPVSFISSGNMVTEPAETVTDEPKSTDPTLSNNKPMVNSSSYGAFEMHTTGFGSRMMAKMGYVDGGGLGKDGRGIAEPIEAIQRPKSLGLGAKIPETGNVSEPMNVSTPPPQRPNRAVVGQGSRGGSESRGKSGNVQFGCFEKHTKGFGSKMMAKMGFVEGMGLGRDAQGMVQPLVASRLPRSRGLGAKG